MDKKTVRIIPSNPDDFERQFAYVDSIINKHRTTAIATVNMESLLTAWEVGQYISIQLKSSHWGSKVVSELADYLKRQNPKRRGFGKRNLYNMVKFFDTYNTVEFARITQKSKISEFVQLETAQIGSMEESNELCSCQLHNYQCRRWFSCLIYWLSLRSPIMWRYLIGAIHTRRVCFICFMHTTNGSRPRNCAVVSLRKRMSLC